MKEEINPNDGIIESDADVVWSIRNELMNLYDELDVDQHLKKIFMLQIDMIDRELVFNAICPECGNRIVKYTRSYPDSGDEIQYCCESCGREYGCKEVGF